MLEFLSDYKSEDVEYESILAQLREFNNTELLEIENFASVLGYKKSYSSLDNKISPKGYRILGKISKLTKKDIEKMEAEIEHRKLVVRKEALEDVKEARAQGDLSENFEYKAAKKFKNENESRIRFWKK